jgi:hypothetical protein
MFEAIWIVYLLLTVWAAAHLFPRFGLTLERWAKGLFYGMALLVILGWALLKSLVVLGWRRLLRQ